MTEIPKVNRKTYFRFKKHPGDLLRNDSFVELPDPETDREELWVWFHRNYQGSEEIAYLSDLHKILEDNNDNIEEGKVNNIDPEIDSIHEEINVLTAKITDECYQNFYLLLKNEKIEILRN